MREAIILLVSTLGRLLRGCTSNNLLSLVITIRDGEILHKKSGEEIILYLLSY